LKGTFHLREVDRIRVKGKEEPVSIYEALDALPEDQLRSILKSQPNFEEALDSYLNQQWEQSKQLFQNISNSCPDDGILQIYIERCEYFKNNPPPEDWDGVWTMKTK
jgi:adenylate cyclase